MQKVVGSSPIIRSQNFPAPAGFFVGSVCPIGDSKRRCQQEMSTSARRKLEKVAEFRIERVSRLVGVAGPVEQVGVDAQLRYWLVSKCSAR
jgi:hypothetical protein